MSTSASIAVRKNENEILNTYCHFDGYISGVGKALFLFYNTIEKALELVEHGDAFSIHVSTDTSVFYHRDRGEDLYINIISDFSQMDKQSYCYKFDGIWYVDCDINHNNSGDVWTPLECFFKKEARKIKLEILLHNKK